jgi:hypothetical protein
MICRTAWQVLTKADTGTHRRQDLLDTLAQLPLPHSTIAQVC